MSKRSRTIFQYLIFFLIGLLFVWLSLKNLTPEKLQQIKASLRNARYWIILPVFAILLLSHIVRALRWKLLIDPLGRTIKPANSFFAMMIGYLVNQGVPRMGEVVRCTMLSRYEKVPVDKLIGTVILERLVDAFSFFGIVGITLAIQPKKYSALVQTFFSRHGDSGKTAIPGYVLLLTILGLLVVLTAGWMLFKRKSIGDLSRLLQRIRHSVWQGITSVKHLKKKWLFLLYTILLWTLYLVAGYIGFYAFAETSHYGLTEAFTVLSAGSIGMIVTPGGIGAYAYLIQKTMPVYGLDDTTALAFGWVMWLVTTAVIVLFGLLSFVFISTYNKKKPVEKN